MSYNIGNAVNGSHSIPFFFRVSLSTRRESKQPPTAGITVEVKEGGMRSFSLAAPLQHSRFYIHDSVRRLAAVSGVKKDPRAMGRDCRAHIMGYNLL
jgi:hypothetical protein